MANHHVKRNLYGVDLNKIDKSAENYEDIKSKQPKVPETLGFESSFVYLLALITSSFLSGISKINLYPAIISIAITTILGFADDIFDIPWRYKMWIPILTSVPMVLNYDGSTTICFHGFLSPLKTIFAGECLDIGIFYHVYMALLTVFCTHSINIYAGINGLEAGQSFVVACFLLFHSLYYWATDPQAQAASVVLIPFIFTTYALLYYNWYPSKVFVGDTFTLTAGAALAASGILGHFAEMTLLFMLPQLINFVYSLPQLVGIVPCPRHRLPRFNAQTGKLEGIKSNMNLVNLWLILFGPKTEGRLCIELLFFQIYCGLMAYILRCFYNNPTI